MARALGASAAVLTMALLCACSSGPSAPAPAQHAAAPHRVPSSALVFETPYVRAWHAELGAGPLDARPEYDRREWTLSQRSYWPVLGTRQWPEPERPREGRIPTIYSRWGRSF